MRGPNWFLSRVDPGPASSIRANRRSQAAPDSAHAGARACGVRPNGAWCSPGDREHPAAIRNRTGRPALVTPGVNRENASNARSAEIALRWNLDANPCRRLVGTGWQLGEALGRPRAFWHACEDASGRCRWRSKSLRNWIVKLRSSLTLSSPNIHPIPTSLPLVEGSERDEDGRAHFSSRCQRICSANSGRRRATGEVEHASAERVSGNKWLSYAA